MNESVTKAVDVLIEVSAHSAGIGARELSQRIGVPRSTVQRLLQTLQAAAIVEQDPATRRYLLGAQTLQLGMVALSRVDVRTKAMPHMAALREESGETVGLSIRVASERMYIEQLTSRHELKSMATIGRLYPLVAGAPGRLFLAYLDEEALARTLAQAEENALTGNKPPSQDRLRQLIAEVRQNGFAVAFEETIAGVNTVAAPIRDRNGLVAALSLSGPASRFDAAAISEVRQALLDSAAAVSHDLGFVSPHQPALVR